MTRTASCLVLSLFVAACVPPKATVVDEGPAGKPGKPAQRQPAGAGATEPSPDPPRVVQDSEGMILPDFTGKLPDRKDMTATGNPKTGGGVSATPPTADKGVNE